MKVLSNGNAQTGRRITPAKDRRKEPRFETSGRGELTVFDSTPHSEFSVTVIDVSRSGFKVELPVPLEPGACVELRLTNIKLLGEVVSCRRRSEGCYRVSLLTTLYIEAPKGPKGNS